MGSIRRMGARFAWVIMLGGIFLVSGKVCAAEEISVDFPADRGIYQRNYSDTADVSVTVDYSGSGKVKARIVDGGNAISDWSVLDNDGGSKYSGTIPSVKAGGWYALEAAAFDDGGNELARAEVGHIGVGEVFITGGQSNSCNFGGAKTASSYDTVSAYDAANGTWQHCEDSQPNTSGFATGNGGGSPWPTLGDELSERLGVPIGFCSTGFGGATMEQLATEHYEPIKQAITDLARYGYRAFLIHQGEADADSTPMEEYRASLEKLISMTRADAGYDLTWIIAQVSYAWSGYNNQDKMEAITSTQRSVCNNYDIFTGPTTDDLQGDYRYVDNLHLSEKGLIEHGKRWADVIITKLFTKYQLNADGNVSHGRIEQCGNSYYAGEDVKLTAYADDGYYLVPGSFKVTDATGGEIELSDDAFKMRAEDLTVTAEFASLPDYLLSLGSKIKEAELINPAEYEAGGINALNAAIAAAKTVYANPFASESEARAAEDGITSAMAGLVRIQGGDGNNNVQAAGSVTAVPENADIEAARVPAGGTYKVGNLKYKILSAEKMTVSVIGIANKDKTSFTVPKSVKIKGGRYKVVSIAKKAFAKARKLKKVVIKSTRIKSIGRNAFGNAGAGLKIKVPKKKLAEYGKLVKKSGVKRLNYLS